MFDSSLQSDPRAIFEAWAPRGVIWSEWAKPVLLVQAGRRGGLSASGDPGNPTAGAALAPRSGFADLASASGGPAVERPAQRAASPWPDEAAAPPALDDRDVVPPASPLKPAETPAPSGPLEIDALIDACAARWPLRMRERRALVLDLPASESIAAGLALARRGFRPVPLFNTTDGPGAIVDVQPILRGLVAGAEALARIRLDPDAPPAFLIDEKRTAPRPQPGLYDNRWIVFPQDFPAASLLRAHAIEEAIVVRRDDRAPEADLLAVLDGWRHEGIRVGVRRIDHPDAPPRELPGRARRLVGPLLAFAAVFLGLRRNSAGGFGAAIPFAASGGGFG
ncbi:MAG TPA: hypothetical protein PKC43_04995 [Phycisphaerales bacterium]|nr:hypothetical protein [Phycisphaerales bacterium]HMP36786.1 hypothetical protein [Phycisphaerales bacterium]